MFSFENCPDIEMVSNVPEFLGDTLNICGARIAYFV
jgi:hypothetical protein